MKSYAVTIRMKAKIWSKLSIPFNRPSMFFFWHSNEDHLAKIHHHHRKKLLVFSKLSKSESDTSKADEERRYSSIKSRIYRHLYHEDWGGGGG